MKSCYDHLTSTQLQSDGTFQNYYDQIDEQLLDESKDAIFKLIQEGFDNNYLTKEEFEALDPHNKGSARFYQIFKVHKKHPPGTTPLPDQL